MGNQITIKGNLTRDPSLKTYTKNGKDGCVCNITIACDRRMGDITDFHNCFQFGKGAEALEKYFSKGKQILVYAEAQNDTFVDKETGKNRTVTKYQIDHWEFCGSKADNDNSSKSEPTVDSFQTVEADIPF